MAQVTASDAGGASIRRMLIPAILLPLGLGWLRLAGEREGLFDAAMGTALVMLTFVVVFTSFVYWTGRRTSQSSAALMDSERQFRIMGETVPFGVWLCGSRWRRPVLQPIVPRPDRHDPGGAAAIRVDQAPGPAGRRADDEEVAQLLPDRNALGP